MVAYCIQKFASHRYIYFFELLPYITIQIPVIHQLELILLI